MPNNILKKKYKKKQRSCPLCKPHKMNWADKRKIADIKEDQKYLEQLKENE